MAAASDSYQSMRDGASSSTGATERHQRQRPAVGSESAVAAARALAAVGLIGRAPGPAAPPVAAAIGGGGWGSRKQPQPQQASKKGEEGSSRRVSLPWSSKAAKPPTGAAPSSSSSNSGQGWWPPRLPRLPALRRAGNWAVEELEEYEYEEGKEDDEGQHMLPRGALVGWGDGSCMHAVGWG